jgi:hypothetical protein
MPFRLMPLLSVLASVSIACSEAPRKNDDLRRNGVPFVFGASGADATAWAARARQEPNVEIVSRDFVNERSVYTAINREDLDRQLQTAKYVVVRRWLTVPQLKELDALAKVVFADLSNHLEVDIKAIDDGKTTPPDPAPALQKSNPESAVSRVLSQAAELHHTPRDAGGFGAVICTLHFVAFIPPVARSESSTIAEKAKAGLPLSEQERQRLQLDQIRELLISPAK